MQREQIIIQINQDTIYFQNQLIGRGSYGQVYKGLQLTQEIQVAVKIINLNHKDCGNRELKKKSSNRQWQAYQKVQHKNVLKLYSHLIKDNKSYFVLQYCDKNTLQQEIYSSKIKRLTQQVCLENLKQIVSAVSYMHSKNIIHRDLKPNNILITTLGDIKICDFGVSKQVQNNAYDVCNGTITGTRYYKAPQIQMKSKYSAKCDVWSIGIILVQMLTGSTPFSIYLQKDLLRQQQNQTKDGYKQKSNIHYFFKYILSKTLVFDMTKRWQIRDLQRYINQNYDSVNDQLHGLRPNNNKIIARNSGFFNCQDPKTIEQQNQLKRQNRSSLSLQDKNSLFSLRQSLNTASQKFQSSHSFDKFKRYFKYLISITQLHSVLNKINLTYNNNPQTPQQKFILTVILYLLVLQQLQNYRKLFTQDDVIKICEKKEDFLFDPNTLEKSIQEQFDRFKTKKLQQIQKTQQQIIFDFQRINKHFENLQRSQIKQYFSSLLQQLQSYLQTHKLSKTQQWYNKQIIKLLFVYKNNGKQEFKNHKIDYQIIIWGLLKIFNKNQQFPKQKYDMNQIGLFYENLNKRNYNQIVQDINRIMKFTQRNKIQYRNQEQQKLKERKKSIRIISSEKIKKIDS